MEFSILRCSSFTCSSNWNFQFSFFLVFQLRASQVTKPIPKWKIANLASLKIGLMASSPGAVYDTLCIKRESKLICFQCGLAGGYTSNGFAEASSCRNVSPKRLLGIPLKRVQHAERSKLWFRSGTDRNAA